MCFFIFLYNSYHFLTYRIIYSLIIFTILLHCILFFSFVAFFLYSFSIYSVFLHPFVAPHTVRYSFSGSRRVYNLHVLQSNMSFIFYHFPDNALILEHSISVYHHFIFCAIDVSHFNSTCILHLTRHCYYCCVQSILIYYSPTCLIFAFNFSRTSVILPEITFLLSEELFVVFLLVQICWQHIFSVFEQKCLFQIYFKRYFCGNRILG